MQTNVSILFIGNSHTFVNSVPGLVADLACAEGVSPRVAMLAHGGWRLSQHINEPEAAFNIRYGHYDYVVLQEHTHPFEQREAYLSSVQTLCGWIREAGAVPVIYATWAQASRPEDQPVISALQQEAAAANHALLADAGSGWLQHQSDAGQSMFAEDGAHASIIGSSYAAQVIWHAIKTHM